MSAPSSSRKRQKVAEGKAVTVLIADKPARQGPVLGMLSQPSLFFFLKLIKD